MSTDNTANIGNGAEFDQKESRWQQERLTARCQLLRVIAYFRELPNDRHGPEMERYESKHGTHQRKTLEECLKPNPNLKGFLRESA